MSFTEFQDYQNELRRMLWQDRYRDEIPGGSVTPIAPLRRTMHLTYPTIQEELDLVVVVESNG